MYELKFSQGQGRSGFELYHSKAEAKERYLKYLGSVLVAKNNKYLSFDEICIEFGLNKEIAEEIIEYKKIINRLYDYLDK